MEELQIFESYLGQLNYIEKNQTSHLVDFSKLVQHYDNFLFDGFGTLYFENHVFEDAQNCISKLKSLGKQVRLVTNAASRTRLELSEKLLKMGLGLHPNEIISSGSLLTTLNQTLKLTQAYHLGRESALEVLSNAKITHNNTDLALNTVIMTGVPPEGFRQSEIDIALRILSQKGAQLIILNPDVIAPVNSQTFVQVAGFYGHKLAQATKCQVIKLGKPFPLIFEKACYSLFPKKGATLFVGDTLWTDIAGANHFGIDTAIIQRGNSNFTEFYDNMNIEVHPNYLLKSLKFD